MALLVEIILLMLKCFAMLTTIARANPDKNEQRRFNPNALYTSSLAPSTVPDGGIMTATTSGSISSKKSSNVTLTLSPSFSLEVQSTSLKSITPATPHLTLTDASTESNVESTIHLNPTMSHLEVPLTNQAISETPHTPLAIPAVNMKPSILTAPASKVNSPVISPTPALKLKPEEEAQVSALREEELSPQPSPAPALQPSRSYSSYTEVSLIVPSTTEMATVVEGKGATSDNPISTSTQKTVSIECSTRDCFEIISKEMTTPKLIPKEMTAPELITQEVTTSELNPKETTAPGITTHGLIPKGMTVQELGEPGCESLGDVSTAVCEKQIQRKLKCTLLISSCHGHCGKILDSCSCDINCGVYNVCCDDFEDVCPGISEDAKKSLGGLLDVNIECVGEYTSYLVIAGCPEDYTNSSRRKECEDGKVLINSVGGLQFKNIACLRCHGFTESEKWTKSVFVNYGRGNPFLFFAGIDANRLRAMSISIWKVPNRFNNVSRVCLRDIIDECPRETDRYLSEKCSTSNANVFIQAEAIMNVYKNVFCVYCNVKPVLFCRGTSKYDYNKHVKIERFSSMISMMFEKESEKFILEVSKPFAWSKAVCTGTVNDLNCIITKCRLNIPPENNTCGLRMSETCVWMEFYTSVNVSKDDLLYFPSILTNVSIRRPDMEIEKIAYALDFLNHLLTFRLIFTLWTGPFPYTLDDLYDSYSVIAGNFLTGLELEGEFSLCFNMIPEMNTCHQLKCEIRNYTTQDSLHQNRVSNGAKARFIRSRDEFPVASCLSLVIAITCLI